MRLLALSTAALVAAGSAASDLPANLPCDNLVAPFTFGPDLTHDRSSYETLELRKGEAEPIAILAAFEPETAFTFTYPGLSETTHPTPPSDATKFFVSAAPALLGEPLPYFPAMGSVDAFSDGFKAWYAKRAQGSDQQAAPLDELAEGGTALQHMMSRFRYAHRKNPQPILSDGDHWLLKEALDPYQARQDFEGAIKLLDRIDVFDPENERVRTMRDAFEQCRAYPSVTLKYPPTDAA